MKKKLAALLMASVMVLSACGASEKPSETGSANPAQGQTAGTESAASGESEGAAEVDLSKTMTFSIFSQADDVPNPEELFATSPVFGFWKDKFNLELEWQLPPQGSEAEQLTLMFGTGDYTDIIDMSFNKESQTTLCEDGAIYNLTPYLEKYMPNYWAFLEANDDVRGALMDEEGNIYIMAVIQENPAQWGGLMYRRDILETMTGGNVAFPSGKEDPATVEDWEYMLELMVQYFKDAGFAEYAGLILPSTGYFQTGELLAGFGIGGTDYLNSEGKAAYGIAEDNFYNYLTTMNRWYEKGYIYADFASRSQDLFYLPNTALTYGGSAGIWFGFTQQLGGTMSMPDLEIYMDVAPISAPTDTANGITAPIGATIAKSRAYMNTGWAVSTACDEEKLIRALTAFDYFYTDEGAATRTMGLSEEQGSANYARYTDVGLPEGSRIAGTREWTEGFATNPEFEIFDFSENRMAGIVVDYETRPCDLNDDGLDLTTIGDEEWSKYGFDQVFPASVTYTAEETDRINTLSTNMTDYANTMIVNFIMGREELNPESFAAYQEKLKSLGLDEYLEIKQAAYDRYVARTK